MYSILIIDDDPFTRVYIETILQLEGFDVRTACDGTSGIAAVRSQRPDLLLCDIIMPELSGLKFLELLRQENDYADIPFIFVTSLGERDDIRRGMSAGADDYLSKPFSAEELISAVTNRLHRFEVIRLQRENPEFQEEHAILREMVSTREREVLLLVGKGTSSKVIAANLGISLRTVEAHRANLMRKLNAANAAMLARWAAIAEKM